MARRRKNTTAATLYAVVIDFMSAAQRVVLFDRRPTWWDVAQRLGHHNFTVIADMGRINVVAPFDIYLDFDANTSSGTKTTTGNYVEMVVDNLVPPNQWSEIRLKDVFPRLKLVGAQNLASIINACVARVVRFDTVEQALARRLI